MHNTSSDSIPVIGLVAWHALPVIDPSQGRSVGGLETGAWTLAVGLAQSARAKVLFFVSADRPVGEPIVEGVQLIPHVNRIEAIRRQVSARVDVVPKLRVKHWNFNLLWQVPFLALSRPWRQPALTPMCVDHRLDRFASKVDIWFGFGANGDTARIAATAIAQRRPMLLFLESNADLDRQVPDQLTNAYGESPEQQRYALQNASWVVCQSQWQVDRLQQQWGKKGVLVRNPIVIEDWQPKQEKASTGVLWIGRYDQFHKRTHLAIEIARLCPDLAFTMIINRGDPAIEKSIRAQCPPNVTIIDYVPFNRIAHYFQSARVFLSTGHWKHEGFPNVLLQAAASRTPIVSMFDFDDFLKNSGAGMSSNDSVLLASQLIKHHYLNDRTDWDQVSQYLRAHHSRETVIAKVLELVEAELSHP